MVFRLLKQCGDHPILPLQQLYLLTPGAFMTATDVVFALAGDVRKNSRALKQLRALGELGARVDVLSLGPPVDASWSEAGAALHVLPLTAASGPRFFGHLHRRYKAAASGLPARVYHASDLFTLPAMAAAARRHGAALAYDARELYAHVAATTGRPWVRWFWRGVEASHVKRADAVFTVSESIADYLAQRYGITRPWVLYNAPPQRPVLPSRTLHTWAGVPNTSKIILHQGHMQRDRGCALLIDAMRDVQGGVLVFLGNGPLKPALQQQAITHQLEARVRFLDPVPPDALLRVTASADVGVTLLEDTCLNHRFALPNKLFEYLAAGLPVLASNLPELRRVVAVYDVGCVVDPTDGPALVSTLQRMLDDARARAHWKANTARALETFSWEKASERFKHTYRALLTASS